MKNQVCAITHFFAVAIFFGFASPACAEKLPLWNDIGYYAISWGGMNVGGLVIEAQETETTYAMRAGIKLSGLAWTFTKHSSLTTMRGIKKNGQYIPRFYETEFWLRGKLRHIRIGYDETGKIAEELYNPPENPIKRPPPTAEQKAYAKDPLTPFFIQRVFALHYLSHEGESSETVLMFDGRRLTDMHLNIEPQRSLSLNDRQHRVVALRMSRTPIAGYKKDELEDYRKGKDPYVVMYYGLDNGLLPLRLIVESGASSFYANRKSTCADFDLCMKKLK